MLRGAKRLKGSRTLEYSVVIEVEGNALGVVAHSLHHISQIVEVCGLEDEGIGSTHMYFREGRLKNM